MNKLIEDKRYDDVVKIYDFGIQRGFQTSSGRAFPTDVVMLAIEALYRQVKITHLLLVHDEFHRYRIPKNRSIKQKN